MKPEGEANTAVPWGAYFLPKFDGLLRDDMYISSLDNI